MQTTTIGTIPVYRSETAPIVGDPIGIYDVSAPSMAYMWDGLTAWVIDPAVIIAASRTDEPQAEEPTSPQVEESTLLKAIAVMQKPELVNSIT